MKPLLSIRLSLLIVASVLGFTACHQAEPIANTNDLAAADEWQPGLTYTASDVEAEVDDRPISVVSQAPRGVYNNSDNTETHEGLSFTLRDKTYSAGGDSHVHIVPQVDFDRTLNTKKEERKHVLKSVVVFYDKTDGKTILAQAKWNVYFQKSATQGAPDMTRLTLDKVTLPAGTTLEKNHTWYMMGFLGGAEIKNNTVYFKLNRLQNGNSFSYYDDMYLANVDVNHRVSLLVPFASGWRQVQVDDTKITPMVSTGKKRTDHITFTPQAAFIELRIENYMSQPMKLGNKITMESNCSTTEGAYDFSSLTRNDANFSSATPTIDPQTYWKPTGTRKPGVSDEWIRYNGLHFVSVLNLNGLPSRIAARSAGGVPTQVPGRYIVAVMPFNPKNPPVTPKPTLDNDLSTRPELKMAQTLFYGAPAMKKNTGDAPTTDQSNYDRDPSTLTPNFGSRYLLGSTGDVLKKNYSYAMKLRLIRPMLPIERLYIHKTTELGYETNRNNALSMPSDHMNSSLRDKYRLPYWTEISTFLTVNYSTFKELQGRTGGTSSWGPGYTKIASVVPNAKRVLLEPKPHGMYDMTNFYSWRTDNSQDVIYGIMYLDPNTATQNYINKEGGYNRPATPSGYERTNMYKVAVRISFPSNKRMKLDTYYIGSNLDINNQFYHLMHPSFWATVDQKAIITRTLPFNTADDQPLWYWGEGQEQRFENKNPNRIPILRSGSEYAGHENEMKSTAGNSQTVYWLKDRSW